MTTVAVRPVRSPARNNIIQSIIIALVLTLGSYLVGYEAHWITTINWLEVFAVFTSYSCTYLCVVERRIQYPIGAVSTLAYAFLFYHYSHLNASAVLNLWLSVQLIYGWFRWRSDDDTRPVSFVGLKWWPAYIVSTVAFYLGAVWVNNALGGHFAKIDASILVLSILAQWLLDNKKLENWIVWFAVDVIAIWEYFHVGLNLVGFQYIFFLANTFYGFILWEKSRRKSKRVTTITSSTADLQPGETFTLQPGDHHVVVTPATDNSWFFDRLGEEADA